MHELRAAAGVVDEAVDEHVDNRLDVRVGLTDTANVECLEHERAVTVRTGASASRRPLGI